MSETEPQALDTSASTTNGSAPSNSKAIVKSYDRTLQAAFCEYRTQHSYSLRDLARQLGSSESAVSKYLNGKPEGDVQRLEVLIGDVMKTAARRSEQGQENAFFESSVSRQFTKVCDTIKKTNDFALIHGEAGVGKTRAGQQYYALNPLTVFATVARWHSPRQHRRGDVGGLETLVFNAVENTGWSGVSRRALFIVERLKGSNRLIILDNAHRLTNGGLQWLFDLHDATGCPVALVGNPEILDLIRRNDQMFSRIGLSRELMLGKKNTTVEYERAAENLLRQYAPEHAEALHELAVKVVKEQGHLRALKKHLLLLPEIMEAAGNDPVRAFRTAHEQLVTADYEL